MCLFKACATSCLNCALVLMCFCVCAEVFCIDWPFVCMLQWFAGNVCMCTTRLSCSHVRKALRSEQSAAAHWKSLSILVVSTLIGLPLPLYITTYMAFMQAFERRISDVWNVVHDQVSCVMSRCLRADVAASCASWHVLVPPACLVAQRAHKVLQLHILNDE